MTRFEAKRVGSPLCDLAAIRRVRSNSLWLVELTLGSCCNAFGVKNRTAGVDRGKYRRLDLARELRVYIANALSK
jgi:hypothetical protein